MSMVFWERSTLIQIYTWKLCCHSVFGAWPCTGMLFARTCRYLDGILGKTYTYSDFYLESEKKSGACVRILRCISLILERGCGKERGKGKKRTWRVLTWRFHIL